MARGVAPILLMTSLGAAVLLLVAVASAAAVPNDAIRLPTDTGGMAAGLATARGGEERPWGECCDLAKSLPPICRCLDKVDSCSSACEHCEETEDESSRTCADWYKGDPGPQCHGDDGAAISRGGLALAAERQEAAADDEENGAAGDDEKRPWKCCSLPICTRSWPQICHCFDEVKRCSSACDHCEKVEGSGTPHRYRCLDTHRGDPGPKCGDKAAGWWPPAVANRRYRF